MNEPEKTREQLFVELTQMREKLVRAEASAAELRQREDRYRLVAEASQDMIAILDLDGIILYANQAAAACVGLSPAAIIGKKQQDIFPPEMAQIHLERIKKVVETGQVLQEDELFHFSDQDVWLRVHLVPLRGEDGKINSIMVVNHNITDRKKAEQELTKSRAILQAAIDCLPFDFFALGPDGRYILQNATCRSHLGDFIGKTPEQICPNQADLAVWLDNNRRAFAGQKVEADVTLSYQGEKRCFHNIVTPIRDGKTMLGILGVNVDITERKQAEEVLQKAHDELEQRVKQRTAELVKTNEELAVFRKFAEAAGQGFGIGELDGRIVYVNPTLCRLLGEKRPEDAVGKFFETYHTDQWKNILRTEAIPALERQGHWAGEMPLLSPQGELNTALFYFVDLKDDQGKVFRRSAVVTDITERKRTEAALQKNEERFRSYFLQGLIGMAVTARDKRWLEINDRFCEILGYSREQLLGKKFTDFIHPGDLKRAARQFGRIEAGKIDYYTADRRFVRKDGNVVYTTVFVRCFRTADGKIDHLLALVEDVTQRKKAQEALQREHRTLKHLLQSSDHERQMIAYEIHDGLAQELAGAIMQFQTFSHLKDANPKEAQRAHDAGVAMLHQAHFEARRLIAGVRPPVLDESGVREAIDHLVQEESRRKGPRIDFQSSVDFGRLAPILENAIYRIIQEGLANARKHSKSKTVQVRLTQRNQRVRIEIRDQGIGFVPENVKENCFGLAGIRQRARLLGGKSSIRSAPGKGARITVELPLAQRD